MPPFSGRGRQFHSFSLLQQRSCHLGVLLSSHTSASAVLHRSNSHAVSDRRPAGRDALDEHTLPIGIPAQVISGFLERLSVLCIASLTACTVQTTSAGSLQGAYTQLVSASGGGHFIVLNNYWLDAQVRSDPAAAGQFYFAILAPQPQGSGAHSSSRASSAADSGALMAVRFYTERLVPSVCFQ